MNSTTTITLSHYRFFRLRSFLMRWLGATSPDLQDVRIKSDGTISALDAFGWHDVGDITDWLPLARALGAFRSE